MNWNRKNGFPHQSLINLFYDTRNYRNTNVISRMIFFFISNAKTTKSTLENISLFLPLSI